MPPGVTMPPGVLTWRRERLLLCRQVSTMPPGVLTWLRERYYAARCPHLAPGAFGHLPSLRVVMRLSNRSASGAAASGRE